MEPIPIPSHIHYEVPLQLLEQQTLFAVTQHPLQRELVQELIITLRKALAQQKRLEESCEQAGLPIEHRWSLHHAPEETQKPLKDTKSSVL
jgi:hypothetical protein